MNGLELVRERQVAETGRVGIHASQARVNRNTGVVMANCTGTRMDCVLRHRDFSQTTGSPVRENGWNELSLAGAWIDEGSTG